MPSRLVAVFSGLPFEAELAVRTASARPKVRVWREKREKLAYG
ncbi:MAG: hypothetical protein ACE14M_16010 [Terriglobales bacterium]